MRRLYYVADNLMTTKRVSERLHREGISGWHFHVLARDEAGLYNHHIHSATTYQQLDVIHTGERWALVGAAIGLAVGLLALYTGLLPWSVDGFTVLLLTLIGGLFGAWQGGMVGLSRENYKLAPFHEAIEAGRYLIMVDVKPADKIRVREIMSLEFPTVAFNGADSTLINPFARPLRVYHQNTH